MAAWEQFDIVSQVRANGLLIGVSFQTPDPEEKNWWYARSVRSRMLDNGVWAISDREDTIRMYPALNMKEKTLLEGLDIMEEAIRYVNEHGQTEGNSPAWPTGVAGF
jgi:acetylornithine/succinyldiaminopimelate/putrescine aminotransferase